MQHRRSPLNADRAAQHYDWTPLVSPALAPTNPATMHTSHVFHAPEPLVLGASMMHPNGAHASPHAMHPQQHAQQQDGAYPQYSLDLPSPMLSPSNPIKRTPSSGSAFSPAMGPKRARTPRGRVRTLCIELTVWNVVADARGRTDT